MGMVMEMMLEQRKVSNLVKYYEVGCTFRYTLCGFFVTK